MKQPFKVEGKIRLKDFDPAFCNGMDKEDAKSQTIKWGQRIGELQHLLYANARHALVVLFQGMDASGKDGAVRRVLEFVNPAGVQTANFKIPSAEEIAHDYLWRVHHAVPRYGYIGVFNRSHYEDVLIVRVLNLQPPEVWKERFDQINAFEKFLADNRILLLKFFLHIGKSEQADRFKERLDDPSKNWKFSMDDLKMRAHWDAFQKAYEDVLNHCSTGHAPWHIVPSDRKWFRDYLVAKVVAKALEDLDMHWPKPKEDLSKIKIDD
ncbi:MAG: polyphosphate kinase 2 family protein [Candidatus Omnitrophica bacterium]|nr:polyphosphate kinase 2 family protein [Candidatus Omnitrophota bacterium]